MLTRRRFAGGAMLTAAALAGRMRAAVAACPFRVAVINDEISADFDHACQVAAHDFGLRWIELRSMWGVNVTALTEAQIAESKRILARYGLGVTDVASPLFKVNLPGAPVAKEGRGQQPKSAEATDAEQAALLEHCIGLAKTFGTDRIRCFDYWRLEDQRPFRAEINRRLAEAAATCGRAGVTLLLENEMSCNTATGAEAAAVLKAIPDRALMLNWDPGNAGTFAGDVPYPDGYALLPKERIGHVHCKNVRRTPGAKEPFVWEPVDVGVVDWTGQFAALARDGYHHAVSLETHYRGHTGGEKDAEVSTRRSFDGMKKCLAAAKLSCP